MASATSTLKPSARVVGEAPSGTPSIRVGVIGATGYAGGELLRLLERHPNVQIVGLQGRDRHAEPIERFHAHLAGTPYAVESSLPPVDAVFLALPHGAAAKLVPELVEQGTVVIDLGPDFRLSDAADYPRWYHFEHPAPTLLSRAVYGLPELHRAELNVLAEIVATDGPSAERPVVVGAPGCYPTATILALAPLARAGLIEDLVVDAKSGVSGAGRDPKPELSFAEVNESVKAYGIGGHRHVAEVEQELAREGARGRVSNPGIENVDFLPHLVPMTRGILSSSHVRPTRAVSQAELDELYAEAYRDEPFVRVVSTAPTTKHVWGSNHCRVSVHHDPRTGRVLAVGVVDNLVKGAAGQGVQAFNLVFGLPETTGLEQLALVP